MSLIIRLLSVPKISKNKIENLLEKKEKSYDTIKTVDNLIKGIKKFLDQE